MERRTFLTRVLGMISSIPILGLMGCGRASEGMRYVVEESGGAKKVYVYLQDLFVLRFDRNPGQPIEILPAENIKKGVTTEYYWSESDHAHYYEINADHYEMLKRGETIVIETEEEEGHTHKFMVNPKVVVHSSSDVKIPLQGYGDPNGESALLPEEMFS